MSDLDKGALAPCPFCDSRGVLAKITTMTGYVGRVVLCSGCQARTNLCADDDRAVVAWNTRTLSSPSSEAVPVGDVLPVAELVERLRADQTISLSWPTAALLHIDALNHDRLEAADALTSQARMLAEAERERDEARAWHEHFVAENEINKGRSAALAAELEEARKVLEELHTFVSKRIAFDPDREIEFARVMRASSTFLAKSRAASPDASNEGGGNG